MNRAVWRSAVRWGVTAMVLSTVVGWGGVAHAQTIKRVAVIMFKPQNYGTQWVSEATVRSAVWTSTTSVDKYYYEESFGKWRVQGRLRVDGDVFGWFTVPYDNVGTCVRYEWITAAKSMAAAQGFVETNYDALILVTAATGCPGRAWTSGRTVTVLNGFDSATIEHELGHAFGLNHASAWQCKDAAGVKVSISSTCSAMEYGDYAVMGATTQYHMNNFQKGALGFLAASNTRDVTTAGVYALYPTETKTTMVQTIRIPRRKDSYGNILDYYYLEFRQKYGFDTYINSVYVNGITIRVAPAYTSKGSRSYLIDATTPSTTGFNDAPLAVGGTFTDPNRRVSITLVSVTGGVAQVRVDFF